jgi:hypothetical protein
MRYKIAEQLEQAPSLAHRPDGGFRSARTTPVGPAHAMDATTGAAACGVTVHRLDVLDQLNQQAT